MNPIRPLAQKAQANLQPTWVERQIVVRSPEGMTTASMPGPSLSRKRYFSVPSFDRRRSRSSSAPIEKDAASFSRNAADRFVIRSNEAAPFL